MDKGKQPRGARQAEIPRLTGTLIRIRDLIREASVTPGHEWETLGSIHFLVMRTLGDAAP